MERAGSRAFIGLIEHKGSRGAVSTGTGTGTGRHGRLEQGTKRRLEMEKDWELVREARRTVILCLVPVHVILAWPMPVLLLLKGHLPWHCRKDAALRRASSFLPILEVQKLFGDAEMSQSNARLMEYEAVRTLVPGKTQSLSDQL